MLAGRRRENRLIRGEPVVHANIHEQQDAGSAFLDLEIRGGAEYRNGWEPRRGQDLAGAGPTPQSRLHGGQAGGIVIEIGRASCRERV